MNHHQQDFSSFDEYLRQGEPTQQEAASNWKTAIGLQAVDGLQPSAYLIDVAKRNIEGEITIDETRKLIDSYYQSKTARTPKEEEEEADKVSANIAKILSTKTFAFNTNGYVSLHRRIFEGVFKHAGEIRQYDISKKEWVLEGDSVSYLNWEDLRRALDWDIEQEKTSNTKTYRMMRRLSILQNSSLASGRFMLSVRGTLAPLPSLPSNISAHWATR